MIRSLIIFALLTSVCSADAGPEVSDTAALKIDLATLQHEPENRKLAPFPRRNETCIAALATAKKAEDGAKLSAFRLFNDYPPSPTKKVLSSVDTASTPSLSHGLAACVENSTFAFNILIDGVLIEGALPQIHPLTAWEISGNHLAFYLHKNYEMTDGEGESVEISAIFFDSTGLPIESIQGISSWYEYEGSVRIRDFRYSNGNFVTTEKVFDPAERDHHGNVLKYGDNFEDTLIKTYYFNPNP